MNPAYLLWAERAPTPDNWQDLPLRALAEWSDELPTLFLLLVGPEPARVEWPVFGDGPQPQALACPWPAAAQRLQQLQAWLAQPQLADSGAALRERLAPVAAAFAGIDAGLLVLDVSMLLKPTHGRRFDKPAYRKAMDALQAEAGALAAQWGVGDGPTLQGLLARPRQATGHWGPEVEDGFWLNPADTPDELPDFLAEFIGYWHGNDESAAEYDPLLGAYLVRRCRPGQANEEGAVTANGRWLLPLAQQQLLTNRYDDDATRAWVQVLRGDGDDTRCALLDANGVQVLPPDYRHASPVGDRLAFCQRVDAPPGPDGEPTYELRRLDTGEVVAQGLDDTLFSSRGDGFIEAAQARADGDDNGKALFDFDGRRITEYAFSGFTAFHKKLKVAGAARDGRWGLIDTHGRVVLPMVYAPAVDEDRRRPAALPRRPAAGVHGRARCRG